MKLLVMGRATRTEHHFLRNALRVGYKTVFLTPESTEALEPHHNLTVRHQPHLTKERLSAAMQGVQAVVVMARFFKNKKLIQNVTQCMLLHDIRRLIVVADELDQSTLAAQLQTTPLDWTIIQNRDTDNEPTLGISRTDLAGFVLHQLTEVMHVRSSVLVTSQLLS